MDFIEPKSTSRLAIITITCGWVFTVVAALAVLLLFWSRRIAGFALGQDDHILLIAFAITIGLVSHTTWAIVDEGLGQHFEDVATKSRRDIVRVSFLSASFANIPVPV